jgi:hypothetical protein
MVQVEETDAVEAAGEHADRACLCPVLASPCSARRVLRESRACVALSAGASFVRVQARIRGAVAAPP